MANTVNQLNYANTFGDWMVTTDALASENNILAKGDYTKDSGTLTLNETSKNALVSNGAVVFQNEFRSSGVGSSVTIDNNVTVRHGTTYLKYNDATTANLALVVNGQANVDGLLFANGSGTSLLVTNNTVVGGNTIIHKATVTDNLRANSFIITEFFNANTRIWTGQIQANTKVLTDVAQANTLVVTDVVQANSTVNTSTVSVTHDTLTNYLQANTNIVTGTALANNIVITPLVLANNRVVTDLLQANTIVYSNTVQANNIVNTELVVAATGMVSGTIRANNTIISNTVQANNIVNTELVVAANGMVSGTIRANNVIVTDTSVANTVTIANTVLANNIVITDTVRSNTIVYSNTVQANATVNTTNISVSNTTYTKILQANTSVNTDVAYISNTTFTNVLQANSSVNTATVTVTGTTFTDTLNANTRFGINGSDVYVTTTDAHLPNVVASSIQVNGNFVINGQTVYGSNTFTLADGVAGNQNGFFNVYRPSGANAVIRWNESSKYWDIRDVNNSSSYSKILTANLITDSVSTSSSSLLASATAVKTAYDYTTTANTSLKSYVDTTVVTANTSMKSYVDTANTSLKSYVDNSVSTLSSGYVTSAYNRANSSSQSFVGTNATSAAPTSPAGVVTFATTNGMTVTGSGSTLTIATPQDLRTTASPAFAGLSLTTQLDAAYGGTGATSKSAAFQSLIYGHTGTYGTTGYVLTTNGAGTYYWASAGSGGSSGAAPGTWINTSRLSATGNGAVGYTGNSYTGFVASSAQQVRAYINGVRQFESEYNLSLGASANTIAFTTTPAVGDKVLIEVDGYIERAYYANNIAFTPTATLNYNIIQNAIEGLDSATARKSGTTFTGDVIGLTMETNASNTSFATTAFVKNALNQSANTFAHSITGNAGSVTNGVYTTGTYSNPSWITALANTKITGTFPTTSITGLATSATTDTTNASNITSGTLPNARLSAVPNSALQNNSITISGTSVALGSSITLATSATTDTSNATNISSGTLGSARLPTSGVTAATYSGAANTHNITVDTYGRITSITNTAISITKSQVSDFPTLATSATTDTTNATNITSGTLDSARLPYTVNQNVGSSNSPTFAGLTINGSINATGDITAYYNTSDKTLKENIVGLTGALTDIDRINAYRFNYISRPDEPMVGVIAQELQEVYPELVYKLDPTDENSKLAVRYELLTAVLLQSIKELKAEVEALKGK